MLQPSRDRLDYSHIITPPVDYRFEAAVGTTYSLDLAALLGIPIALVLGQSPDERLRGPGIPLLEALRKTTGKIALFCQAGRIAVPQEQQALYALLERSIAQVLLPRDNSFHPKVWVIKYIRSNDKTDALYRVVVLSRNLTFDRSWDVAAVVDGKPTTQEQKHSAPLAEFLSYLASQHPNLAMRRMVKQIAAEIRQVHFAVDDKRFQDLAFCPVGVPGIQADVPLNGTKDEITVISPFLSKHQVEEIKRLLKPSGKAVLISRKEELDRVDGGVLDGIDCWHLKEAVVDGENCFDEPDTMPQRQDIHAKLYLTTRYSWSALWMGSANCSHKAFNGNVEFLLRLEGYRRYCNQDELLRSLFGDDEKQNPFTRYEAPSEQPVLPDETEDKVLEQLVRDICRAIANAKATASAVSESREAYQVEINLPRLPANPEGFAISIEPIARPKSRTDLAEHIAFSGIPLMELSTLYVIRIGHNRTRSQYIRSFVAAIPTTGIPSSRDSAIFRSVVASKEEFFAYMAFILGDDYALSLADHHGAGASFKFGSVNGGSVPVVYEKMLKAASRRPEALAEVGEVIDLCGGEDSIVSDEFKSMYSKFEAATAGRRRRR